MIISGRVRFHPDLEPLLRPIDSVQPHPENYNNADTDLIGTSIDENGMCDVILAQVSTGYILSGNHTWMTLKERASEVAPIVLLDVDDIRAMKIMVAMNTIPRRARPDKHALLRVVTEIEERDSLVGTGIDDFDIEALSRIAEMVPSFERADWPMLMIRISPQMMKAYRHATREADTDTDRFELLLRLAGAL